MSERFYINWPLAVGPVALEGAEAHHLAAVCRLRPGDAVCLFNGDGREYPASVVAVQKRRIELDVIDIVTAERELNFYLEVAAPLPKGDRGQFLIEKLTELGVAKYVPLGTRRTVVHPREGRLDKLERYVIEASKQCGRNRLMQIAPPTAWESYSRDAKLQGLKILAHPGEKTNLPCLCLTEVGMAPSIFIAVGPEGGFADEEIVAATGWTLIDLGPRILRVETAALTLAAFFMTLSQAGSSANAV